MKRPYLWYSMIVPIIFRVSIHSRVQTGREHIRVIGMVFPGFEDKDADGGTFSETRCDC
jgi:hypothetical protein